MRDAIEYLQDRWECDRVWRDQIVLAAIIGLIGLLFAITEARAVVAIRRGAANA